MSQVSGRYSSHSHEHAVAVAGLSWTARLQRESRPFRRPRVAPESKKLHDWVNLSCNSSTLHSLELLSVLSSIISHGSGQHEGPQKRCQRLGRAQEPRYHQERQASSGPQRKGQSSPCSDAEGEIRLTEAVWQWSPQAASSCMPIPVTEKNADCHGLGVVADPVMSRNSPPLSTTTLSGRWSRQRHLASSRS